MSTKHLNQNQLAERWNLSPRTLERWRCLGQGPVPYRLEDLEQYEANRLHANTNGPLPVEPTKAQA
jgi:hypothetical protein